MSIREHACIVYQAKPSLTLQGGERWSGLINPCVCYHWHGSDGTHIYSMSVALCMGCMYGLCVYSGILALARVTTLGCFLCTDSRGLLLVWIDMAYCTLPRPLEPHSQTLIPRPHGASFPNSHTQTTWSLIPRLSFPNSHTQTTWSLIPRLSYPNSHTQTPRNLVPKLSLTSVLFSIILPWLQAFIGVTSFYSSRPLLCDSQTLIPKLSYPDPTEPYYSLVRCCVPVANVLASKNLQACCDDTIFFTWASGGCDNMPIRLITKDQSTHEIFALEKGLPVPWCKLLKAGRVRCYDQD